MTGLGRRRLRRAAAGALREVRPRRATLREDVLAGVPGAISSVPDGMASSVLVGVNPVYGLYASAFGPIAGGLTTSTRLMVVTTTGAAALAAGSALSGVGADDRDGSLFLLVVLAGAAMIVAGALRLGRYTRFVSHSVMIGFLTGVAVNIVLGQVPELLGVSASGGFAAAKAADALRHLGDADPATVLVGLGAVGVIVVADRTPARLVGAVLALAVPTVAVVVTGADSVARVRDQGTIPAGLPMPQLPELRLLSFELVAAALSIAAIVLVQGVGVAESAPNPSGARSSPDRDFVGQGIANLASGLFRGIPVGGSVGQTALNVSSGARSRWGAIWSGGWMLMILLVASEVVALVAMPTLAAVLVYAAVGSLRITQVSTVLRTGQIPRLAVVATFVATVFLPVPVAVGTGVALSLVLQLDRDALDLVVKQIERRADGAYVERDPPAVLPSGTVILLDVHGSLLYAGSRTLQVRLPDPAASHEAVVVLRLRGRTSLGATFFTVVSDYARRLADTGGRLYLSGVDPGVLDALRRTDRLSADGPIAAYAATDVLGESSEQAVADATVWLVRHRPSVDEDEDEDDGDER